MTKSWTRVLSTLTLGLAGLTYDPAHAQESASRPTAFVASSGNRYSITSVRSVSKSDPFATELGAKIRSRLYVSPSDIEWPYASSTVVIACARGGYAVIGVNGVYSALNGTTSTAARRGLRVQDQSGRSNQIVISSDNANLRAAGIVRSDATNPAIGSWDGEFLDYLLPQCS